ncbi:MAG: hypothetical protein M1561_05220 [Gammaproteobacteria bacterium]|nr:hypothetical protein [Gammaproteobacteria bacterium]
MTDTKLPNNADQALIAAMNKAVAANKNKTIANLFRAILENRCDPSDYDVFAEKMSWMPELLDIKSDEIKALYAGLQKQQSLLPQDYSNLTLSHLNTLFLLASESYIGIRAPRDIKAAEKYCHIIADSADKFSNDPVAQKLISYALIYLGEIAIINNQDLKTSKSYYEHVLEAKDPPPRIYALYSDLLYEEANPDYNRIGHYLNLAIRGGQRSALYRYGIYCICSTIQYTSAINFLAQIDAEAYQTISRMIDKMPSEGHTIDFLSDFPPTHPHYAIAQYLLGTVYEKNHDTVNAISCYENALQGPEHIANYARIKLFSIYKQDGTKFEQACKLARELPDPHYVEELVESYKHDSSKFEQLYKLAEQLHARFALSTLGNFYHINANPKDDAKSQRCYLAALECKSIGHEQTAGIYYNLARIYFNQHNLTATANYCSKILAELKHCKPKVQAVYFRHVGNIYKNELQDPLMAIKYYELAQGHEFTLRTEVLHSDESRVAAISLARRYEQTDPVAALRFYKLACQDHEGLTKMYAATQKRVEEAIKKDQAQNSNLDVKKTFEQLEPVLLQELPFRT